MLAILGSHRTGLVAHHDGEGWFADARPLIYGVQWPEYTGRLVAGTPDPRIRLEPVEVKMPHPVRKAGSIYNNQSALKRRFFETLDAQG
jgi:hypothetical protein